MKHITEQYGGNVSYMECTTQEYEMISAMLKPVGVETRKIRVSGNEVVFQAANPYRDTCILSSRATGQEIADTAKRIIDSGAYRK